MRASLNVLVVDAFFLIWSNLNSTFQQMNVETIRNPVNQNARWVYGAFHFRIISTNFVSYICLAVASKLGLPSAFSAVLC